MLPKLGNHLSSKHSGRSRTVSPQQTHGQVSQDLFSHSIFELQLTSYTRGQELHRDCTAGPIIRFPFLLCHHLLLTSTSHLGPFYFPKRIRPLSAKRHYSCYFSVWNLLSLGVLWVHSASPLGLCKNALFSQAHYPLKNGHRFMDTLDSHPLMYFSLHDILGSVTLFLLDFASVPYQDVRSITLLGPFSVGTFS